MRVKRASFVLFDLADGQRVDLAALLRGEIDVTPQAPDVYALALLTGRRERMTHAEFGALLTASAGGFVEAGEIGTEAGLARSLAERGLLISDSDDEPFASFRAREADLVEHGWNLYAAGYHFMTKREGMDLRDDPAYRPGERAAGPELKQAFVEAFGASAPPFHSPAPDAPRVTLPRIARDDGLYAALAARRPAHDALVRARRGAPARRPRDGPAVRVRRARDRRDRSRRRDPAHEPRRRRTSLDRGLRADRPGRGRRPRALPLLRPRSPGFSPLELEFTPLP